MSNTKPTVLVCGQVTRDLFADGRLVPGGSVYYAARTSFALGADTRVATTAGQDFDLAALSGFPSLVSRATHTTLFENGEGPNGRTQRVLAVSGPVMPENLPSGKGASSWRNVDVLHLAPVLDEIEPRSWIGAVNARVVGLGVQGLVRRVGPGGEVLQHKGPFRRGELEGVRVAFFGEDDTAEEEELVGLLKACVPVVVFTRAEKGCDLHVGGRFARIGVFPTRAVDPTGAGDAFAAGFLLALAEGAEEVEAARLGAAAGSIVVEGEGGATLSRMGEARDRAARVPVLLPLR